MWTRLAEDHALAKKIGAALAEMDVIDRGPAGRHQHRHRRSGRRGADARTASHALIEEGVKATVVGPKRLRIVTHLDVGEQDAEALIAAFERLS